MSQVDTLNGTNPMNSTNNATSGTKLNRCSNFTSKYIPLIGIRTVEKARRNLKFINYIISFSMGLICLGTISYSNYVNILVYVPWAYIGPSYHTTPFTENFFGLKGFLLRIDQKDEITNYKSNSNEGQQGLITFILCLVGIALCLVSFITNVYRVTNPDTVFKKRLSVVSTVLAFVITLTCWMQFQVNFYDKSVNSAYLKMKKELAPAVYYQTLSAGFGVTVAASGILLICALCIFFIPILPPDEKYAAAAALDKNRVSLAERSSAGSQPDHRDNSITHQHQHNPIVSEERDLAAENYLSYLEAPPEHEDIHMRRV